MGEDCHEGGRGVCEQVNFSDLIPIDKNNYFVPVWLL